ncbi:hypothetical protein [Intrasporangium oryzae]|uniref:hypothetical protein n=1 Tax=Intrasporangium oryzae TaxID=412687 RepID=UPI0012FCE1AE|nr:hypothetical protein [Intrasporangium oryzae]
MRSEVRQRRVPLATAAGLVVGGLAYFLALFDYRLDPTRTAVRLGYASNFFDIQAQSFLEGRIDVPAGSLGIEGFIVDGKTYMYFPPFPALLRVPIMLVTRAFDGQLTLASMALAWLVFATMTSLLLWQVRRCISWDLPVSRLEAAAAAVFIAAATGGSVVTFDASLPWVYHEVYLWAVGLVIGTIYWLIRTILEPTRTNAIWLGGFALASALTRTTGGWAVCLVIVGVAGWFLTGRAGAERRARWRLLLVAGGTPLLTAIVYNAVKFNHPFLFPLQNQVWTQVNAHRREALGANGGSITGPQFLLTSLVNYFRPDGIRFVGYFPWITLPAEPARAYGGAFLDQYYRTGSITAFMPLLFLLSVAAVPVLLRRTSRVERQALRPAVLAGVLVSGGVMAYGYVAYRYTSEFVPALVVAGSVGLWASCAVVERWRRPARDLVLGLGAALALFGVAANLLTAHAMAATTWRGDQLREFVALQERTSGGKGSAFSRTVKQSATLPADGETDELHVVGNCDALYLNTGDAYEPWVLVERRPDVIEVRVTGRLRAGKTLLLTAHGSTKRSAWLETTNNHFARVLITSSTGTYAGPWFGVYAKSTFRIGVSVRSDLGFAEVTSTPGGFVGYLPFIEWDKDWNARPGRIDVAFSRTTAVPRQGITLTRAAGVPPTLCQRLLADAR